MTDWNVDLPKLVESKIYAIDIQVLKEFLNIVLCEIVRRKIEEPTKEFWDIVNKETDKIFNQHKDVLIRHLLNYYIIKR